MTKKKYLPRVGSRLSKVHAQWIGSVTEAHGGLSGEDAPRALVDAARDKSSPGHTLFEWNVKKAAAKWNLRLARVLIQRVVYVVTEATEDSPAQTARAFVHLRATEDFTGGYFPGEAAVRSPVLRERVFDEVERRLRSARQFAGEVKELVAICDEAIEKTRAARTSRRDTVHA